MKKKTVKTEGFWTRRAVFSAVRAAAALLLAAALLWVSGFAFVYQLGSATAVTDGSQLAEDEYVSADVKWIMDIPGQEVSRSSGRALYCYAVAPIGNRFVLLRFEADRLDDLKALKDETLALLNGERKAMSIHMPVSGMVEKAEPGAYSLLSQWFNNNIEWMTLAGVVGQDPSASDYLTDLCIMVDKIGAFDSDVSAALSIGALVLVLYALTEAVLLLTGYYRDSRVAARVIRRARREKEKAKAERKAEREAQKLAAKAAAADKTAVADKTEAPANSAAAADNAATDKTAAPADNAAPADTAATANNAAPADSAAAADNATAANTAASVDTATPADTAATTDSATDADNATPADTAAPANNAAPADTAAEPAKDEAKGTENV